MLQQTKKTAKERREALIYALLTDGQLERPDCMKPWIDARGEEHAHQTISAAERLDYCAVTKTTHWGYSLQIVPTDKARNYELS